MMTPIIVSLNDDDLDGDVDSDDYADIIVITYGSSNGVVRAVSGLDGTELWNVSGNHQYTSTPAAADIDHDGIAEIIVPSSSGVIVYEHDGTLKFTSASASGHFNGTSDSAAVADLDADGEPEIILGRAIFDNQGQLVGSGQHGTGVAIANVGSSSVIADLDVDGYQEVVVGNAVYQKDGTALCYNGENDGYPAVADFDGDMEGEVVVSSGNGEIRLQDGDCSVIWRGFIPGATQSYYGGPPTIADYDGDLEPEIGVAANNSYTVFDTDGTILWQMPTQDISSGNTGSAVFDFEGDGIAEAIYGDEIRLWGFNGPDGAVKLESMDHSSNTWTEYCTIADIDNDDHAEIIIPNNNTGVGSVTGITVIEDADDSW
jgi:hypothetical protein